MGALFLTTLKTTEMTVSKKGLAPTQNEQTSLIIQTPQNNMLVDARLLHQRLGIKVKFADWIKRRMQEYGLLEGQDFFRFLKKEKAVVELSNITYR
jgi:predicted transcriptional regulator